MAVDRAVGRNDFTPVWGTKAVYDEDFGVHLG